MEFAINHPRAIEIEKQPNKLIPCKCGCGGIIKKYTSYKKDGRIYLDYSRPNSYKTGHYNKGKSKYDKSIKVLCACGCGKLLTKYGSQNKERRYLVGHQNRGKCKYDKTAMIYCNCGCEKLRTKYDKQGVLKKYINGHGCKGKKNPKSSETKKRLYKEGKLKNWNKGLTKETDERIKKYGNKISLKRLKRKRELGYINSIETRKKISDTNKRIGKMPPSTLGVRSPRKGKNKYNDPSCNKISIGMKKYYQENPAKMLEKLKILQEARKYVVLPKKDTSIEVKIQNFLKQLQIPFFTHQYMKEIEHGYQCDVFIPSMNLVIECDGDYWHKYPVGCEIDHIRTSELISEGFKVLRLWECEIRPMRINEFKELINE